jgi:hypothetical protein
MNSKELKDIGDQYSFEKVKEEMEKCWITGLLKDLDAYNAAKHGLVRTFWGWDGQENPLVPRGKQSFSLKEIKISLIISILQDI